MSERNGCAPNMPRLSPYLIVRDAGKALDFYEKAFGFVKREVFTGPDGGVKHAEMTFGEAVIMFAPEAACGAEMKARAPATSGVDSPIGLYLYCADVDALYARATAAGARGLRPPTDMFWGDRSCHLVDPDGYAWSFGTHKGQPAAKA